MLSLGQPYGDDIQSSAGVRVASPLVIRLIAGPEAVAESETLEPLAKVGDFVTCRQDVFWPPLDSTRDKNLAGSVAGRPRDGM